MQALPGVTSVNSDVPTALMPVMQDRALPVSSTSPLPRPALLSSAEPSLGWTGFPMSAALAWRVSGRDDSEDSRSRSLLSTRYKHYLFVMSSNVISISAGPFFQRPPAVISREKQVEDALVSEVFCFICFPLRQDSPAVTTDKGH